MPNNSKLLVLIPYGNDIGFAIGRLISAFHAAASRALGDPARIHYCFSEINSDQSSGLPPGFDQVVGYNVYCGSKDAITELATYANTNGITAVFALDLPVQAPCLRALRAAGVNTIVSYWGAPISPINTGARLLAKRAEVRLFRRHRPDLFIFESNAMCRLATHGRGIPSASTTVIPTGVDTDVFRPQADCSAIVYETFDIPKNRHIVVFMGHLHERKGVSVLLEAAEEIVHAHRRTELHFLFLGNRDSEQERFRQYLGAAYSQGYVTFGGYHRNIPDLLAGCHIGCIPSTGWDSFPMSSLELQACGIPVVVSRLQGVPETIEEDVTGLSVPVADSKALASAILRLSDHPEQHARMSAGARQRIVTQLSREQQISRLAAMFETILSSA